MKRVLEWSQAVMISVGLTLLTTEIVLRYDLLPIRVPPVYESYWFMEHPDHFNDQHDSYGYIPLSVNREAALHADLTDAVIEYDVTFQVNNAGLVQRRNIQRTQAYTAIVGDSFVQGVGARPWFYDLEMQFPNVSLANLGVTGTGVSHWNKAAQWFENNHASIKDIVVVFITDDFLRPHWIARHDERGLSLCYENHCELTATLYHPGGPKILLDERRELLRGKPSPLQRAKSFFKPYVLQLRVGQLAINLRRRLLAFPAHDGTFLEANKRAFSDLSAQHRILFALHLPEKEEAEAGRWSDQSRTVQRFVESTGVQWMDGMAHCKLTTDGFLRRDPHPNANGYARIRQCLVELLTRKQSATVVLHPHP